MSATPASTLAHAKPESQRLAKRRQKRADARALLDARAVVFGYDLCCRFPESGKFHYPCGPARSLGDQLAHLDGQKRSQTRNQAPEVRHDPAGLMRLCERHHAGYDGCLRAGKQFTVIYLTSEKARGLCRFIEYRTGRWLGDN